MNIYDVEEADEASYCKQSALSNLRYQVLQKESMGIVDMYERAAWNAGATVTETELTITTALKERS